MTRLLLAATLAAASFAAVTPPAQAQPCVVPPVSPTVSACYLDFGAAGRGAGVVVVGTGYAYVLAGCYYPGGQATYYVGAGSSATSPVSVNSPVRGVPCV